MRETYFFSSMSQKRVATSQILVFLVLKGVFRRLCFDVAMSCREEEARLLCQLANLFGRKGGA